MYFYVTSWSYAAGRMSGAVGLLGTSLSSRSLARAHSLDLAWGLYEQSKLSCEQAAARGKSAAGRGLGDASLCGSPCQGKCLLVEEHCIAGTRCSYGR